MIVCSRGLKILPLPCTTTWFMSWNTPLIATRFKSRSKNPDEPGIPNQDKEKTSYSSETQGKLKLRIVDNHQNKAVEDESDSSLCSILDNKSHVALYSDINMDSIPNLMVGYILSKNIMVHKVALDSNVCISTSKFTPRNLERHELPKIIDPKIKIGRFSENDSAIICKNWATLVDKCGVDERTAIREVFEDLKEKRDIGLKRNIIGYFLSQNLPDIRLATDVFYRAWRLKSINSGSFTANEDKIILNNIKADERKFAKLSWDLKRSRKSVRGRFDLLVREDNTRDGTKYTLEDDKIILTEVFAVNKNALNEGYLVKEDLARIGKKLQRSHKTIYHRWNVKLKPLLKKYHAGNLHADMKDDLINHMVANGMNHAQDVNWKELTLLPEFSGSTERYLQHIHGQCQYKTKQFFKDMNPEELTSVHILKYLNTRITRKSRKSRIEYDEQLIAFYSRML